MWVWWEGVSWSGPGLGKPCVLQGLGSGPRSSPLPLRSPPPPWLASHMCSARASNPQAIKNQSNPVLAEPGDGRGAKAGRRKCRQWGRGHTQLCRSDFSRNRLLTPPSIPQILDAGEDGPRTDLWASMSPGPVARRAGRGAGRRTGNGDTISLPSRPPIGQETRSRSHCARALAAATHTERLQGARQGERETRVGTCRPCLPGFTVCLGGWQRLCP